MSDHLAISKPPNVRLATPHDEEALFETLMALSEDNGFGFPVSERKVMAQIQIATRQTHVDQGMFGVIGVIESKYGRIDATIGIFNSAMWYTDRANLSELWLFVRQDARNNNYHHDLFNFAKWARQELQRGTDHELILATSVSSPKRLAAKLKLWSKYAKQVGGIFYIGRGE